MSFGKVIGMGRVKEVVTNFKKIRINVEAGVFSKIIAKKKLLIKLFGVRR